MESTNEKNKQQKKEASTALQAEIDEAVELFIKNRASYTSMCGLASEEEFRAVFLAVQEEIDAAAMDELRKKQEEELLELRKMHEEEHLALKKAMKKKKKKEKKNKKKAVKKECHEEEEGAEVSCVVCLCCDMNLCVCEDAQIC